MPQVLTDELPGLVGSLSFKKSMRWNSDAAYSRPLRWLLALHGSVVLPFTYAGLQVGDCRIFACVGYGVGSSGCFMPARYNEDCTAVITTDTAASC